MSLWIIHIRVSLIVAFDTRLNGARKEQKRRILEGVFIFAFIERILKFA